MDKIAENVRKDRRNGAGWIEDYHLLLSVCVHLMPNFIWFTFNECSNLGLKSIQMMSGPVDLSDNAIGENFGIH
jgi:hypothetical protein